MPKQYACLSEVTVGAGGASTITFSSIPSTYTDLYVKVSGRSSRSNTTDTLFIKINNASGVTTSHRRIYGFGTTIGSDSFNQTIGTEMGGITANTATSNTFSNQEIYIPNYTSSSQKITSYDGVSENNSSSGNFLVLQSALWQNTGTVTSLVLQCDVGNFIQYTTATLYGITKS